MAQERQQDMVLAPNEQLFALEGTSGQIYAYCGPYKEALSTDSHPVIWDGQSYAKVGSFSEAKRTFVKAREGQYIVLRNPATDEQKRLNPGKNPGIPLQVGKTVVVRGPVEFALWPGQEAEVVDGHRLDADEYLKVRVIGPVAEEDAHRLWPIVREDWRDVVLAAKETVREGQGSGDAPEPGEGAKEAAPERGTPPREERPVDRFPIGAEYIILGRKTSFFIPPTGMIVLPKEGSDGFASISEDAYRSGRAREELSSRALRRLEELDEIEFEDDRDHDRVRAVRGDLERLIRSTVAPAYETPTAPKTEKVYVRTGVMIQADEYVVLVNRAGRRSIVSGPTTVIPCTDQEFVMNPGTGEAVFRAISIDENSGALLRTLSEMTVAEARRRLPGAFIGGEKKDDDVLAPGTQLVVWKSERLVFPADSIETVRRFEAVHILPGTARYVKNLTTGRTRVVKGEQLYLADPRVEEFMDRELDPEQERLWFPNGGHRRHLVPCITVPQGTAAMVLGIANGGEVTRRILVGHTVHFLDWNETLATVRVSGSDRGEAKDWKKATTICYLWTVGNRINDVAQNLRSRDDCAFNLSYTLTVDFDPEMADRWFSVDDYVFLVCDEVRSRLLGTVLRHPVHEIATNYVDLVRDALLGEKVGASARPGLAFERCGARLVDINVKSFELADPALRDQLKNLQKKGVNESIETRTALIELEGKRERLAIARDELAAAVMLAKAQAEAAIQQTSSEEQRQRAIAGLKTKTEQDILKNKAEVTALQCELDKARVQLEHAIMKLAQSHEDELETLRAKMRLAVAEIDAKTAKLAADGEIHALEPEMVRAAYRLEDHLKTITAEAQAQATINGSILPQVAADLRLLAGSEVSKPVIEALGRVSSLKGMDVTELLGQIAGGVPVIHDLIEGVKARVPNGSNGAAPKTPVVPPVSPPAV